MLTLGFRRWLGLTALLLFFSPFLTENALAASISANPTQGPPSTVVTIRGSEWPPGDLIELSWDFNWSVTVATATADGNGAFTAIITVPAGAPIGPNYIDAGDQAAFLTAQAPFTVVSQSATQLPPSKPPPPAQTTLPPPPAPPLPPPPPPPSSDQLSRVPRTASYEGFVHNLTHNKTATLTLLNVVKNQGSIKGDIVVGPGLFGSGSFSGTISTEGNATFTDVSSDGAASILFVGKLRDDQSFGGTYSLTNGNQQGIWQTTPAPALTTDCAHLVAPWVALYPGKDFGGDPLCFEGTGLVNLAAYDFDKRTRSINSGAINGTFFDQPSGQGNQMAFPKPKPGYAGWQQANLGTWDTKISSFIVDSNTNRHHRCGFFPIRLGVDPEIHDWSTIITALQQRNIPKAMDDFLGHHIYVSVNYLQDAGSKKYKVYNETTDTWFSPDDPDANKHADSWGQFNGTIRYGISTEWIFVNRLLPIVISNISLQPPLQQLAVAAIRLLYADEWLLYDYTGCKPPL